MTDPTPGAAPVHEESSPADDELPGLLPYTVVFPSDDGERFADLEHPAPLPRVGETVEYVDESGACHRFRVVEIVHTLQTSALDRPPVSAERHGPNSLPRDDDEAPEPPGGSGRVRAGLPRVILEAIDDAE